MPSIFETALKSPGGLAATPGHSDILNALLKPLPVQQNPVLSALGISPPRQPPPMPVNSPLANSPLNRPVSSAPEIVDPDSRPVNRDYVRQIVLNHKRMFDSLGED